MEKIDKSAPLLGQDVTQCDFCRHLRSVGTRDYYGWKCAAFGDDDIPREILMGLWDHRRAYEALGPGHRGDGGTRFEQRPLLSEEKTFESLFGPLQPLEDEDGIIKE